MTMETKTATRPEVTVRQAPNPNLPATVPMNSQPATSAEMVVREPVLSVAHPTHYPPKIARALVAVSKKIGAIQKDGYNEFQRYHYQKWEDILNEVSPLLAEHGLLIQQSQIGLGPTASDQLLSITYEFSIISEEGEVWPEHPVWAAMSRLRDSKGVYDDKCANKCHTQALKYFLLNLFKIKTEDDADANDGRAKSAPARQAPNPNKPAQKAQPAQPTAPGEILITTGGAEEWLAAYLKAIAKASTVAEVQAWAERNVHKLRILEERYIALHTRAIDVANDRMAALTPAKTAAPDPDVAMVEAGRDDGKTEEWGETGEDQGWLNDLAGAYSGCEDAYSLHEKQAEVMMPQKGKVSSTAWKKAEDITREHVNRINAHG